MSTENAPQTVKITVDGHPIEVPAGSLLLEALKLQGLDVPNFCYYWNLPAQASCRMCLVRIEKVPRLQPSCTTVVRDGMVVEASSPEIIEMRRVMLDFMLANHPLDCPVCDRGGECELQDTVFKFGHVDALFTEEKHHQPEITISPFIYNDAQRCVFCYRCTRVCDLWMDVGALAKLNRGSHETIGTFDGWLDCEHCGNCVDVCPTGTLMHTSYKYGPRPWNLDETETTCSYCADGCRVRLGSRNEVVHRSVARQGTGINEEYLCVKGRYGTGFINSDERLTSPMIRRNGELVAVGWDDALEHVAARLKEIAASNGADAVAVLGSTRLTNEGNFAIADVAEAIDTTNLSYIPDYDLAAFFGAVGGRLATKEDIYAADRIVVIGGDPKEHQPLTAYFILQAVLSGKTELYVAASRLARIRKRAKQFVHLRMGGEAALLHGIADRAAGTLAAERAGISVAELDAFRSGLEAGKRIVVMIGSEVSGDALAAAAALGAILGDGREVTFRPLAYDNNSIGAFDALGARSPIADFAAVHDAIGEGVKALYAAGADLLGDDDAESVRARLRKLDFLVVQDLFMTEAAALADVVLPAASFAEQDGTFTNIAGQVQRVHRSIEPVNGSRPDWMIAAQIARLLGSDAGYRGTVGNVFKKFAAANAAYEGITYASLATNPWPQTRRPSNAPARQALLEALARASAATDTTNPVDPTPVEMGEGLFRLGTIARRAPLLVDAFAEGKARGRSVEEEAALIPRTV